MKQFADDWDYWLILTTWLPWVLFVACYWTRSPRWWRTTIGRGVMSPAVAVTILLTWALVSRMFNLPDAARDAVRVLIFTSVIAAGWLLLFAWIAEQRRVARRGCPQRRSTDKE